MAKEQPHLKFFSTRCTMMVFHALVWSFLWFSVPEFRQSSSGSDETIDKRLNTVGIVGAVFLGLTAIMTLIGLTLHSIGFHFFFILCHALGILLTILAVLNYWDVLLLWIPCSLTCILPFTVELIYAILTMAGKNQHF